MKYVFVSFVLTLASACGGGGGGSGGGGGGSQLQQIAQQVLETCGSEALDEYLQLLAVFEGLLDPGETTPQAFMVLSVFPPDANVDWEVDLRDDPVADALGGLQFLDSVGDPETAIDVNQLQAGFDDLDTLIPTAPDGTSLVFTMLAATPPSFDGSFTFGVNGGVVSQVASDMNFQVACDATFSFSGASLASVGGAVPTLVITITLSATEGVLTGTVTLDGSNTAAVVVSVDGSAQTFAFEINLTTGAVTSVP